MDDQKGENIEFLSKAELQERLERQRKLLNNRKFLQRLPDKGEKIQQHAEKIKQLILEKEEVEKTLEKFSQLSFKGSAQSNVDDVMCETVVEKEALQSEEALSNKARCSQFKKNAAKKHLKLNVPIKKPCEEEAKELSQTWNYESAITHPKSQFKSAKTLPLDESMNLQKDQAKKLQELETKKAAQRLQDYRMSEESTMEGVRISNPYKYRNTEEFDPLESDSSENELDSLHDEYDDIE